jgi:drug/metabolite transporter (DMT)-like permease
MQINSPVHAAVPRYELAIDISPLHTARMPDTAPFLAAINKRRGIASMIGAVFCFSLMDASLKQLTSTYSVEQVGFFRGAAALPLVLAITAVRREWKLLIPARPWLHVLRGLMTVVTMYAFVYAVRVLSMAEAYTIFLAAPLLVTALSVPLLREQVGWRRWIAIAVGMIGALVMLRPTGTGLLTLGAMAALLSAFTYALGAILIRIASRTDSASATVFWTLLILTVAMALMSVRDWVPFQPHHWPIILLIAVTGTAGQILLTDAFRNCPAGVIAPFEYTALVWGVALDWFVWHVLPQERMFTGAAIVVGSGLYVIYRENRRSAIA